MIVTQKKIQHIITKTKIEIYIINKGPQNIKTNKTPAMINQTKRDTEEEEDEEATI